MSKNKTKKPAHVREDVAVGRLPEESFIAKVERPNLDNRGRWVKESYDRGMVLADIIRGSGLTVAAVFSLCEIDVVQNQKQFDELVRQRNSTMLGR